MTPQDLLERLLAKEHLSEPQMVSAMRGIMDGAWSDVHLAAFLTALRLNGESTEELLGAARVMRERATRVVVEADILLDTCGTGGDGAQTYNISTAVALVAAAAGVRVAKHGNRSVSSRSGSADVLEALGVAITLRPEDVARCIERVGVGFLFAPAHHGAMRHAAPVRKALGFRTVFNLVGPLSNPASATHQLVGIYDGGRLADVASVLRDLGVRRALVVHGCDGLDELTLAGETFAAELSSGRVSARTIHPEDVGLARAQASELAGGSPAENAALLRRLFNGEERGPKRDALLLNAGAALYVAEHAETLGDGVDVARSVLEAGRAARTLAELVRLSQELAREGVR